MMKVSKKQKEVLTFMRSGSKMYKKVTCVILTYSLGCSVATFFFLKNNGLIKEGRPQGVRSLRLSGIQQRYVLTKSGRTIQC